MNDSMYMIYMFSDISCILYVRNLDHKQSYNKIKVFTYGLLKNMCNIITPHYNYETIFSILKPFLSWTNPNSIVLFLLFHKIGHYVFFFPPFIFLLFCSLLILMKINFGFVSSF